ncbi:MAG TPA: hypothetical protein VEX38_01330 [Fimbriimonadaceae bacterium]|nr:hypothetical protein [Fimbriimonadaceae bacterium]
MRAAVEEHSRDRFVELAGLSPSTLADLQKTRAPWIKSGKRSDRSFRSHLRALTRIAIVIDVDPLEFTRAFLESYNEPLTRELAAIVEGERRRVSAEGTSRRASVSGANLFERIESRLQSGIVSVVEVDFYHFTRPADDESPPFIREFARSLIRALNPAWTVVPRDPENMGDLVSKVLTGSPEADFALLFQTVHRCFRGMDFLSIPGWEVQLDGIYLETAARQEPLDWRTLARKDRVAPLVVRNDAAHLYLSGPRSYAETALSFVDSFRASLIAPELLSRDQFWAARDMKAVFVADELTCLLVLDELSAIAPGMSVKTLSGRNFNTDAIQDSNDKPADGPRYPLALGYKGGDTRMADLLSLALDKEMFGNDEFITADLYADLIARGFISTGGRASSTWRPGPLTGVADNNRFWVQVFSSLPKRLRAYANKTGKGSTLLSYSGQDLFGSILMPAWALERLTPDKTYRKEIRDRFLTSFSAAFPTQTETT